MSTKIATANKKSIKERIELCESGFLKAQKQLKNLAQTAADIGEELRREKWREKEHWKEWLADKEVSVRKDQLFRQIAELRRQIDDASWLAISEKATSLQRLVRLLTARVNEQAKPASQSTSLAVVARRVDAAANGAVVTDNDDGDQEVDNDEDNSSVEDNEIDAEGDEESEDEEDDDDGRGAFESTNIYEMYARCTRPGMRPSWLNCVSKAVAEGYALFEADAREVLQGVAAEHATRIMNSEIRAIGGTNELVAMLLVKKLCDSVLKRSAQQRPRRPR